MNIGLATSLEGIFYLMGGWLLASVLGSRARRRTAAGGGGVIAWTSEEVAKLLSAIGTLIVGAIIPLITTIQGAKTTEVLQRELDSLRDSTRRLAYFELRTWERLPRLASAGPGQVRVDDKNVTLPCDEPGRSFAYDATGPAKLHCGKDVRVQLSKPTVVLFLPDP
jgi:hypothetical protein